MNIKAIRRENLRALVKSVGGITQLANKLDKTQSQLTHLIGKNPIKNIGDRIAAQAEVAFNKPPGWLDHRHCISEEQADSYDTKQNDQTGILCSQVPIISWEEVPYWQQIAYDHEFQAPRRMISTTASTKHLAFALHIQDDSMESPSGMSFPENSIIIVDPQEQAESDSFVIVKISKERGTTFKQFIAQGHKNYLKPLNRRYPILEVTPHTTIFGVVKQLITNFDSL